jgi:hypothetical protein
MVRGLGALAVAVCSVALASGCSNPAPRAHVADAASLRSAAAPASGGPGGGATANPAPPSSVTQPGTSARDAGTPRCHTGQLTARFAYAGSASGGVTGSTLVLTNRSQRTCYVYGYEGLGFLDSTGRPLPTHLTRQAEAHKDVTLRPGASAYAGLQWHWYDLMGRTPVIHPSQVEVTPPDEYSHLTEHWPFGGVTSGTVYSTPLSATPPYGPVPTGSGTITYIFNGKCMDAPDDSFANGAKVQLSTCDGATSQRWAAYTDGTLRIYGNGMCLDVAGGSTRLGAKVDIWTCNGSKSQQWAITQVSGNKYGPIIGVASNNALADPGHTNVDGTQLEMGPNRGDGTYQPWHVSFHHYERI